MTKTIYPVEAIDLWKSCGNVVALRRVTFRVKKGWIHGIIGPNGAGNNYAEDPCGPP